MTKNDHRNSNTKHQAQTGMEKFSSKKFHKDWRVWLVISLMLAAIIIYVLTLDDSVVPLSIRN